MAHLVEDDHKKAAKILERVGLFFFAVAVACELGAYKYGQRNDELSAAQITSLDTKAGDAAAKAAKAVQDVNEVGDAAAKSLKTAQTADNKASGVLSVANRAMNEANTAEKDVSSAKKQEADLQIELARIRSPRSFKDVPGLVSALSPYAGTKYLFGAVGVTEESLDTLKSIDEILRQAGWIRDRTPIAVIGVAPFDDDPKTVVPASFSTGISAGLTLPNKESVAAMNALPPGQYPEHMKAALLLSKQLALHLAPLTPHAVGAQLKVSLGQASPTIRIIVGDKPLE